MAIEFAHLHSSIVCSLGRDHQNQICLYMSDVLTFAPNEVEGEGKGEGERGGVMNK